MKWLDKRIRKAIAEQIEIIRAETIRDLKTIADNSNRQIKEWEDKANKQIREFQDDLNSRISKMNDVQNEMRDFSRQHANQIDGYLEGFNKLLERLK